MKLGMLLVLFLVWCGTASSSSGASDQSAPGVRGTPAELLDAIRGSSERTFDEIAQMYESAIRHDPSNLPLRIDECTFLDLVVDEDIEASGRAESLHALRVDALASLFPDAYAAAVYRASAMEPDTNIAFLEGYLRRHGEGDNMADRWELYAQLARSYAEIRQPYKALHYGVQAMRYNDTLDLTILMAEQATALGDRVLAVAYLEKHMDKESAWWIDQEKGEMLLGLGATERAAELLLRAARHDSSWYSLLPLGRALAGSGRYREARAVLSSAAADPSRGEEVLVELFGLDLRYGSGDSAAVSYDRLRDLGFHTDPLGKRRLGLFFLHPTAPVHPRDLLGLLLLFGVVTLVLWLPAFWVLPVHYAGFLRRRPPPPPGRWSLTHLWALSAAVLMSLFFSSVLFGYERITDLFRGRSLSIGDPANAAWFAAVLTCLFCASCVPFMRRTDFSTFWGPVWPKLKSILLGIGVMFLVRLMLGLAMLLYIVSTGGGGGVRPAYDSFTPLAGGMTQVLLDVKGAFGWPGLLFIVVVAAPLWEEFFFRGVALRSMQRHIPFFWANLIQSVLFGVLHGELILGLSAFAMGIAAGILRQRSLSLAPGIALHVSNNVVALIPFMV